ncbi:partner and localizer of BRCA2-like [Morphnus guianensis]
MRPACTGLGTFEKRRDSVATKKPQRRDPSVYDFRYLEGDVKDASAAAVLTSGAVAVWDLLLGRCTALLPPAPAGSWALARWATTGACLLAGQRDGTVCLYRYRQPQPGAA